MACGSGAAWADESATAGRDLGISFVAFSAISRSSPGSRLAYVSEVSVMVECRKVSFTVWMSPPPPCVSVAATWRRSRRVTGGRSVVARMRRKVSEKLGALLLLAGLVVAQGGDVQVVERDRIRAPVRLRFGLVGVPAVHHDLLGGRDQADVEIDLLPVLADRLASPESAAAHDGRSRTSGRPRPRRGRRRTAGVSTSSQGGDLAGLAPASDPARQSRGAAWGACRTPTRRGRRG